LATHYAAAGAPKGELAIVVGGASEEAVRDAVSDDAIDAALEAALATMSIKDASAVVAAATGRPRRDVYQRALVLAGRGT
jgi:16S rRNA (cytidine1402-2'-O)-methyltransferase